MISGPLECAACGAGASFEADACAECGYGVFEIADRLTLVVNTIMNDAPAEVIEATFNAILANSAPRAAANENRSEALRTGILFAELHANRLRVVDAEYGLTHAERLVLGELERVAGHMVRRTREDIDLSRRGLRYDADLKASSYALIAESRRLLARLP